MTVRPSGATVGPSTPESDGGSPMPSGGGVPPAVRNRARSVSGAQQVGQLAAAVRGDVERHHQGLPLRLEHDARLVDAVERDGGQAAGPAVLAQRLAGRGGLRGPVGITARRPGQHPADGAGHPGAQRAAQERAARRCGWLSGCGWLSECVRFSGCARFSGCGWLSGRVRFSLCARLRRWLFGAVLAWVHHDLRGSVMTAMGARSSSAWLAAASICSRCGGVSRLTGVQLPSGCCWASSSVRSRLSQVYADGSPR